MKDFQFEWHQKTKILVFKCRFIVGFFALEELSVAKLHLH